MENSLMHLKVLLPFRVFNETKNVIRIVLETANGSYGLLPQRLDCVAALIPGIFIYETEVKEVCYFALDEGVLVKSDTQVLVSVRNAIGGANLGKLHESIEKEFLNLDEDERHTRSVIAKLESGFIHSLEKFHKQ